MKGYKFFTFVLLTLILVGGSVFALSLQNARAKEAVVSQEAGQALPAHQSQQAPANEELDLKDNEPLPDQYWNQPQQQPEVQPMDSYLEDPYSTHATVIRLKIPKIGINAAVEAVGETRAGELGIPTVNQWDHVGIYKFGARPGKTGTAIMNGHLDRPGGSPAVFWNLKHLQPGDIVEVTDGGKLTKFRVYQRSVYAWNDPALTRMFKHKQESLLNLVTCHGAWVPAMKQTTHRLVIYTKKI